MDIQHLIQFIPGKNPVGINLRKADEPNTQYYQLKDLRYQVRTLERDAELATRAEITTQWRQISQLSAQILSEWSKDLEVAAWWLEAQLRINGLVGLANGFQLLRRLCEEYWGDLYPEPDEDGLLTTVTPLVGLNGEQTDGTLIIPIAAIAITESSDDDTIASWQYQSLLDAERMAEPEKRAKRLSSLSISRAQFDQAMQETSKEFLQQRHSELENCLQEFAALAVFLDEKMAIDAPPTTNIKRTLESILQQIKPYLAQEQAAEEPNNTSPIAQISSSDAPTLPKKSNVKSSELNSREQALQSLMQVAGYFRKNEPHSPIPYTVERCIKWANMPLAELMHELIEDKKALESFSSLIGINEKRTK